MNLADLRPLDGTRDYLEEHWFSPGDILLAHSNDENAPAFAEDIRKNFEQKLCADPADAPAFFGNKYDWYGGYGMHIQPRSIFEVGVAAGYSIAAMIKGAENSVKYATLVDMHHDVWRTYYKLHQYFPDVWFDIFQYDTQTPNWEDVQLRTYDIIHIDGNHTYNGALNDLNHFGIHLNPSGLIVVDDAKDPNILRACNEFKEAHNLDSRFIDNHNGHLLMMAKP